MHDALFTTTSLIFGGLFLAVIGLCVELQRKIKLREKDVEKEKQESARRLYELAILKEIGERAGYSLNVDEVLQIITGSLRQFIDYSVAAYIVIEPEKNKLATYLEQSVQVSFLFEMKNRMAASLSALLEKPITPDSFEEVVSGAISLGAKTDPAKIGSYFNIPLVISGKLSGLLTISHVKEGLYKEEDMTLLYKITAQASNAVTRLEEVVTIEEEKLSKVREEYTSMIVHELRSPLDGMKKIVELMVSGNIKPDSSKFKEYIDLLYQGSSSTLELVNDILDYSKIQAGKFEIEKEEKSIKETIENRVSFYKALADTRKIILFSYFESRLPEKALFDERAIKQVLNNFISNALKFTMEGGAVTISAFILNPATGGFSLEAKEKMQSFKAVIEEKNITLPGVSLVVSVSDTGAGIPKENIKDLFMSYKQINSKNFSEARGTGLGLVIAKGIIEGHGGLVGASSVEKAGSVFYFAIPL